MITLTILATIGFCTALILFNIKRSKFTFDYDLVPNCLITRHPIVFLSGKKTLFYFGSYWNFIPKYLIDHGYEVLEVELPWRNKTKREAQLNKLLEVIEHGDINIHVVGDSSCENDLDYLNNSSSKSIESCWLLKPKGSKSAPSICSAEDLNPQKRPLHEFEIPVVRRRYTFGPWSLLFKIHNWLAAKGQPINPATLGHPFLCDVGPVGQGYLRFAISLAENDL